MVGPNDTGGEGVLRYMPTSETELTTRHTHKDTMGTILKILGVVASLVGIVTALVLGFLVGCIVSAIRMFIAIIAFQLFGGFVWGWPIVSMWSTLLFASGVSLFLCLLGLVERWVLGKDDEEEPAQ